MAAEWFHMAPASTMGWPSARHWATAGAPAKLEEVMPWHSAQCFEANRALPRAASAGLSKKRVE